MYVPDKNLLKASILVRLFCRNIYGIGKTRTNMLFKNYGLLGCVTMSRVTSFFHKKFIGFIDNTYVTEKSLSIVITQALERERDLQSVRGWKLRYKLPINGQRTHTNASTAHKLSFDYHVSTKRERKKKEGLSLNFYNIGVSKDRRKALRKHFKKFKEKKSK